MMALVVKIAQEESFHQMAAAPTALVTDTVEVANVSVYLSFRVMRVISPGVSVLVIALPMVNVDHLIKPANAKWVTGRWMTALWDS